MGINFQNYARLDSNLGYSIGPCYGITTNLGSTFEQWDVGG